MNWLYYELAGRPQVDEKTPGALNRAVANILHEKYLTPAEVDESDAAWERFEAAQKKTSSFQPKPRMAATAHSAKSAMRGSPDSRTCGISR